MTHRPLLFLLLLSVGCAPHLTGPPVDDDDDTPVNASDDAEWSGGDDADAWFGLDQGWLEAQVDEDAWHPGTCVNVHLRFFDQRGEEHWGYPGLTASVNHPAVSFGAAVTDDPQTWETWWFGIVAGGEYEVWIPVCADETAEVGAEVTFAFETTALNCADDPDPDPAVCPEPNPAWFTVHVGDPLQMP